MKNNIKNQYLFYVPLPPLGGEVLTSRIAQLCVIDVLSVTLAVALGEDCLEMIKKTAEAVRKKRY